MLHWTDLDRRGARAAGPGKSSSKRRWKCADKRFALKNELCFPFAQTDVDGGVLVPMADRFG
jgi:hypothetical protein